MLLADVTHFVVLLQGAWLPRGFVPAVYRLALDDVTVHGHVGFGPCYDPTLELLILHFHRGESGFFAGLAASASGRERENDDDNDEKELIHGFALLQAVFSGVFARVKNR